jgi:hypothetical protein
MLYLALVLFSFLAFSGLVFYASTQTLEAEKDPNMRIGTINLARLRGFAEENADFGPVT